MDDEKCCGILATACKCPPDCDCSCPGCVCEAWGDEDFAACAITEDGSAP